MCKCAGGNAEEALCACTPGSGVGKTNLFKKKMTNDEEDVAKKKKKKKMIE